MLRALRTLSRACHAAVPLLVLAVPALGLGRSLMPNGTISPKGRLEVTALCASGGTSSAKPGTQDSMVLASGAIGLLGLIPGFEWLEIPAVVTGTLAYFLPTLCATDPPAVPSFTTAEFLAAATRTAGSDYDSFLGKLDDALRRLAWYQWCKCDAGAQPAAPTPPTQPSGVTVILPTSACFTYDSGLRTFPAAVSPANIPMIGTDDVLNSAVNSVKLPPGLTSYDVTVTRQATGATHGNVAITGSFFTDAASNTAIGGAPSTQSVITTGAQTITLRQAVPATARYWKLFAQSITTNISDQVRIQINGGCNGDQPGAPTNPCLPDTTILDLLAELRAQVDLIQRQSVPFGYVTSTVHTGLSGAGALSIADLIGIKLAVTTLPSPYGVEGTSPPQHFDLGYLTFGSTDGFQQPYRLTRNPQVIFPPLCGLFTDLDYDLSPGVVVTLTELLREP